MPFRLPLVKNWNYYLVYDWSCCSKKWWEIFVQVKCVEFLEMTPLRWILKGIGPYLTDKPEVDGMLILPPSFHQCFILWVFNAIWSYMQRKEVQLIEGLEIRLTNLFPKPLEQKAWAHFLVHFFDVHCTTMMWNLLMRQFMEDVNIQRRIFLSLFEPG